MNSVLSHPQACAGFDAPDSQLDLARGRPAHRVQAPDVLKLGEMAQFAGLVGRQLVSCRHYGIRHAVILVEIELPQRPGNEADDATWHELLEAAGARLRARVRDTDFVAQLEGRRFGVLLTDAGKADLSAVQARLYRAASGNYSLGDRLLHALVRLGAAMYPGGGSTGIELVCSAEAALGWATSSVPWVGQESRTPAPA
jgi:GGDEF domain-containing protein